MCFLDKALKSMEKYEEILKAYHADFYENKFGLDSQMVEEQFVGNEFETSKSVQRKVACLHVYYRLNLIDADILSLMRVISDIHKKFQPDTEYSYLSKDPKSVLDKVIHSVYDTLVGLAKKNYQLSTESIEYILFKYHEVVS